MHKHRSPVLLAAAFLSRAAVVGCFLSGALELGAAASTRPDPRVTHPGKVLVDHDARRIELEASGEELCPVRDWNPNMRPVPPVVEVRAPSGYGIDERFASPRNLMMELGASCLRLEGALCRTIVDTMLAWSEAEAAIVRTSGDTSRFWNDSITVNLDVVRPFVGAYAIARASVPVAPDEDAAIRKWVEKVLERSIHLMRGLTRKGENYAAHNHAVASAAALMAYGAMWGDARYFRHGIDQWFITLKDMRRDGSFPIEARRGARALFYTGRTLSGLMSIAEMARVQGIDLYAHAPSKRKTIHRAVAFMVAALEDNKRIHRYARRNYHPGPSKDWRRQHLGSPGSTLGWLIPYTARFPDHANALAIRSLRTDDHADNGASVDHVLSERVSVMGHWIGARADCLYRAPG